MSTSTPLPIQAAVPSTSGKTIGLASGDPLDSDSKGVFGGLLSGALDATTNVNELSEKFSNFFVELKDFDASLPSSGNSLPTDINVQIEADIVELDIAEGELPLATSFQVQLPLTGQSDKFGIALQAKQPNADSLRTTDTVRSFVINGQDILVKPVESKLASSLAATPDLGLGEDALSFTQLKQSGQLQNGFSPLIRRADVGVEAGQIGRVIEQFAEFTQRATPATAPSAPTATSHIVPLSESSLASSSSGVAQLSVDVPVQDERWQKAFSQRVVWSVGNNQSAQLRVHPAELGRIDIQVNVENDKASVVFNTQHSSVKDAIELAVPRLREMLAEQGVDLVDVDVSQEDINQQQAGTGNNPEEQNELEAGVQALSSDDESAGKLVGHIAVDEDAIDYYV